MHTRIFPYIVLVLLAGCACAQQPASPSAGPGGQAGRDTAEAADIPKLEPLRANRYIELTTEEDVFAQQSIAKKPHDNQYYFKVDKDSGYMPVNYFGDNLAEYVFDVDSAYQTMLSYRNTRMAFSAMFYGGIGLSLIGGIVSLVQNSISPILFVGLGSLSISWVPNYISHDKIPDAVGIFNAEISEKDNNSGGKKP
jgi:hypothetical protein